MLTRKAIKADSRYQAYLAEMVTIGQSYMPDVFARRKARAAASAQVTEKYLSLADYEVYFEAMEGVSEGGFLDTTEKAPYGGYNRARTIVENVYELWGTVGMAQLFDDAKKKLPKQPEGPFSGVFEGIGGWHS